MIYELKPWVFLVFGFFAIYKSFGSVEHALMLLGAGLVLIFSSLAIFHVRINTRAKKARAAKLKARRARY